ncbi:branched-chain alpha-keto acid dehydrogenase subunit E2 [Rhodopseudomonas palustris]|uniref:Dihydrolipoamide acetyltransferase component of pyruvate dehydrogenase complex n=1 Tax=Rhodopseudomonas palustris TaxID=1076 RepID=A0A323USC5_RHOPL|nr:2-oxo acid dehydrogenase subunit E2 [Rhodopseudomonas palustris]PZA10448.1 branched-chain alpha-keto acid dehydrogenase subunit E2 [Rhodopseudomonas palustris]
MSQSMEVVLPDIGDYKDVPVVEVNVSVGDEVAIDTPLLSIESDKATMEVPSPAAGTVAQLLIEVGTRVSQGSVLMIIEGRGKTDAAPAAEAPEPERVALQNAAAPSQQPAPAVLAVDSRAPAEQPQPAGAAHASPSVRALARELGVTLDSVRPTGPKGRILREDVAAFVNGLVRSGPATGPAARTPADWPKADFEKYGAVERLPLTRIQNLTGANLSRSWSVIPHVTNFDRADVTEAEAFRQLANAEAAKGAAKLTMVSLLIKAAALALQQHPRFNSSLEGDELILKRYVHIGFAVDTPKGLVVPVIRDCDQKGLRQIAAEMRSLADKAIAGQLASGDMQGGCFSVSSLGGVGGQGFTPIINAPEVAILGAGRAATEAVWNGREFEPRLVLPLSLSWDHRVVDGVAAARFLGLVASVLTDLRRFAL